MRVHLPKVNEMQIFPVHSRVFFYLVVLRKRMQETCGEKCTRQNKCLLLKRYFSSVLIIRCDAQHNSSMKETKP